MIATTDADRILPIMLGASQAVPTSTTAGYFYAVGLK
jgi:hypothetical protein